MKRHFHGKSGRFDYVLYLLSTTILGTPVFCGLMEIIKDVIGWIM